MHWAGFFRWRRLNRYGKSVRLPSIHVHAHLISFHFELTVNAHQNQSDIESNERDRGAEAEESEPTRTTASSTTSAIVNRQAAVNVRKRETDKTEKDQTAWPKYTEGSC